MRSMLCSSHALPVLIYAKESYAIFPWRPAFLDRTRIHSSYLFPERKVGPMARAKHTLTLIAVFPSTASITCLGSRSQDGLP